MAANGLAHATGIVAAKGLAHTTGATEGEGVFEMRRAPQKGAGQRISKIRSSRNSLRDQEFRLLIQPGEGQTKPMLRGDFQNN